MDIENQLEEYQEQLQEIKIKINLAQEAGKEKKLAKYKQQKKDLKQKIAETKENIQQKQKNSDEKEEKEEISDVELTELEILQEKLKIAKSLNKTKKIQKYEKLVEKEQQNQEKTTINKNKKVKKSEEIQQENPEIQEEQPKLTEKDQESKDNIEKLQRKIEKINKKIEKLGESDSKKLQELEQKKKEYKQELQKVNTAAMDSQQKEDTQKWKMAEDGSFKYQGSGNTINCNEGGTTIVLFYQYIEPQWTYKRFKEAMTFTKTVGDSLGLGGRLRVAYEGFNGTISGSYQNVRQFTEELKKWEPQSFKDTLFKFIDGLPKGTHFPTLKVFEVKELVNYGLDGNQPCIKEWGGVHLPPKEYHKKMEEDNTIIIDVRNTYESIIGKFQPPDQNKCKFLDPEWRKSTELPEWLKSEKTMNNLRGKQVLMYCTGGVRCERASAYINKEIGTQVNGIYQLEGGIEQYMKEFPEGGYWKGKNYTFDKRFAFGAYNKDYREDDVLSECSGCKKPWDRYRGKIRCSACLVPLLICKECQDQKKHKTDLLRCTLCVQQFVPPKRQVQVYQNQNQQPTEPAPNPDQVTRLFVGNLPLESKEETVRSLFRPAKLKEIQWLTDKNTGKFYGSVFIETETPECAGLCMAVNGRKLKGRNVKVNYEAKK